MKTTDVYIVMDTSGSMAGGKIEIARKMLYQMADILAREQNQGGGSFRVTIIPFASYVTVGQSRKPTDILQGWPFVPDLNSVGGGTALRDAIGKALELSQTSGYDAKLISVFTDGEENSSTIYSNARLKSLLGRLEAKGDLTLTFAGPASARRHLGDIGIPEGNFRQWDGSETDLAATVQATGTALVDYVKERRIGATRSTRFYANMDTVAPPALRANTKEVRPSELRTVSRYMAGRTIADFYGVKFHQGSHYYQLVKPEYLQDDKELVIFIKDKGEYRQGSRTVRSLLGVPETGKIRLHPATHSQQYDIYVQSTSNNRKVVEGQQLLTL